ncbi:MAG: ATP synthase F1 subunit delta [Myxococcales bacterium FL481]|nr:MAG: ATP synthase F1 subunit delta [Myxococcales bacterium FL481]
MIPGTLAKRYARALLSLADNPAQRDRFTADLAAVAQAFELPFEEEQTLIDVLAGVHHLMSQRQATAAAVCQRLDVDAKVVGLVDLLVVRGRVSGIDQIARQYRFLADEQAGRLKAEVSAAQPLEPATLAALKACFERVTGKTVTVESSVDPELIGGLVTKLGHQTIDLSVRSTLANLRHGLRSQAKSGDVSLP